MVYCRIGADSDVYLYRSTDDDNKPYWSITLANGPEIALHDITKVYEQMLVIRRMGFLVPQHTMERLIKELAK